MKESKLILLFCLFICLSACNEDEDESVSTSGTPFSCQMILEQLEAESFEAIDLGDFSASCASSIVTINSDTTDTRDIDCGGTTVTASDPNGNITVDMSDVTVSGSDYSGKVTLTSSIGATLTPNEGTGTDVDCSFSFQGDIGDEDDIELSSFSSCNIGGTSISFLDIPDNPDNCSTTGGEATDAGFRMFYAFFDDLASKVLPDVSE
jgi:hypothetical protein